MFALPIAQHKMNLVNSLMRAIRGFVSMILIQCLYQPMLDQMSQLQPLVCIHITIVHPELGIPQRRLG